MRARWSLVLLVFVALFALMVGTLIGDVYVGWLAPARPTVTETSLVPPIVIHRDDYDEYDPANATPYTP